MDNQSMREEALDYIARGKALYAMDHFEDALNYFKRAEASDNMNPDVYLGEGECLIMLDRFDEAKNAYEKLMLIDKNNGLGLFHLGNVAFLQDDAETGREYYAKAIHAGFEDPQIYMNLGFMLVNEGKYQESIVQFNKALALDKFLAEAWLDKAKANMAMNKLPEALQALEGMTQYTPEYFEGHHYKFIILLNQGEQKEAEAVLEQMEKLFPDDRAVKMDRLHFLEIYGDAAEALAYFEAHFSDEPSDEVLLEKAKILCGVDGRAEEALSLFKQVSERSSGEMRGEADYFGMMLAYTLGRLTEAKGFCDALLALPERDANYYNAMLMRGQILERLGGTAEAMEAYQFAVDEMRMATSENPGALDIYLLRVMALRGLKRYQDALELANYLLEITPDQPEVLYVRAQVYADLHMKEESAKDLERVSNADGLSAAFFQYLQLK